MLLHQHATMRPHINRSPLHLPPPLLQAVTDVLCPLLERRFGAEGAELAARAAQQLTAVERDVLEVGLPEQSGSRWLGLIVRLVGACWSQAAQHPSQSHGQALCAIHPPFNCQTNRC